MRKNLLFVIDSLNIGGAEKSLVSLLNEINPNKYNIDLLLFKKGGDFEKYLPPTIKLLSSPDYFSYLNSENVSQRKKFTFLLYRMKTSLFIRLNKMKKLPLHNEQTVFNSIERILIPMKKKYDVAIAYSQGMPTYFVANKVSAQKKLAWINTDYRNSQFDKEFDYNFYKKIDYIITVSEYTKSSLANLRAEYKKRVHMILDIVNPEMIYKMAQDSNIKEYQDGFINILTVGRLDKLKGYDKAIAVAKMLKNEGYRFKWYAIGDGPERKNIEELIIKHRVQDCFILLGKKMNPYPYMKDCDLYVQTSKKEGFGLTVTEAKILKKPIVCTNFETARELIENHFDGLIIDHDVNSIFNGIKKYLDNSDYRNRIVKNLHLTKPYETVNQLFKFYSLIDN